MIDPDDFIITAWPSYARGQQPVAATTMGEGFGEFSADGTEAVIDFGIESTFAQAIVASQGRVFIVIDRGNTWPRFRGLPDEVTIMKTASGRRIIRITIPEYETKLASFAPTTN